MKIEILGTGCTKCEALLQNVKQAVADEKIFAQIEKVDDPIKIMEYQVLSTPALVVNKVVKSSGKLLNKEEVKEFLK
ncbi:thioredoxin family protein [Halarcobacter bivalviorum]|uniref:Thioredoxin family protein n=1 Tax=Halarcobacter bivalviorum TaxID=663364 RepID=A0AAX2AAC3_9BACT|nr:thioredoxin family protein [Halarcobacter bivalviorum]AXH13369.1 thioredoxin family protein (Thioredoxin_3 domain) [Halarcobacter bivalviorum]RXK10028.1 thioredoxin family protein [Halarcobacter bivalviorum]